MNRRTGALVRQKPWNYCYAALTVPGSDRIVLADPWRIWTSSPCTDTPAVAKTPLFPREQDLQRIALDGIIFGDVSAQSLTGAYETPDGWFGFQLDFATMLVTRGNKVATVDEGLYAESGRGFPPSESAQRKALLHRLNA